MFRLGGDAMSGPHTDICAMRDRVDLAALIGAPCEAHAQRPCVLGSCPIHPEKTPSLKVERGRWYCFGCHAHGDAIDWLTKVDGLTFRAALRTLSGEVVAIPPRAPRPSPAISQEDDAKRIAGALRITVAPDVVSNAQTLLPPHATCSGGRASRIQALVPHALKTLNQ
jgi:DNA primase